MKIHPITIVRCLPSVSPRRATRLRKTHQAQETK